MSRPHFLKMKPRDFDRNCFVQQETHSERPILDSGLPKGKCLLLWVKTVLTGFLIGRKASVVGILKDFPHLATRKSRVWHMLVKTDAHFPLSNGRARILHFKSGGGEGCSYLLFGGFGGRLPDFQTEFPPHRQSMTRWSEVQMKRDFSIAASQL